MVPPHGDFLPRFCTFAEGALCSFFFVGPSDSGGRARPSFSLSLTSLSLPSLSAPTCRKAPWLNRILLLIQQNGDVKVVQHQASHCES